MLGLVLPGSSPQNAITCPSALSAGRKITDCLVNAGTALGGSKASGADRCPVCTDVHPPMKSSPPSALIDNPRICCWLASLQEYGAPPSQPVETLTTVGFANEGAPPSDWSRAT